MAEIMDGEFDVVDGTMRLLSAPQTTLDRLKRLRTLLGDLQAEGAPPERVAEVVSEEAPELSGWLRFAPRDTNGLAAFLVVLIMLISLVQDWREGHSDRTMTPDDVERVVKAIIDAQQEPPTQPSPQPSPPPPTTPPSPLGDQGPRTTPPRQQP